MVAFNDRRLTEPQKTSYVRPDIQQAVTTHLERGSQRRISLAFNGPPDEFGAGTRYQKSGYLRPDEDSGEPRLFHNTRSTKGSEIDMANLASIQSSRKSRRTGQPERHWARWSGAYSIPE